MIDNYGFAIPGSVDNGATDTEYTVRPERILSAADERWATHTELDAAIADTCTVMDELEARIEALEGSLLPPVTTIAAAHPPEQAAANTIKWLAQNDWPGTFMPAAHPPEGDWAHVPAAEWEALCAELEGLRAQAKAHEDAESANAYWGDVAIQEVEAMRAELEELREVVRTAPDAPMLRRMLDGQHKVASHSIEEVVRLASELSDLRAKWESIPWKAVQELNDWCVANVRPEWYEQKLINRVTAWLATNAPKPESAE